MTQHCIGSHMADVHTPHRPEERPGQLAQLRNAIFVSVFSPSTAFFEDPAKDYNELTHNNFIKQVSQTAGQRWVIVVAMEVQGADASCLGIFTSCPIRLCCVQISCLPEKERLESNHVIIFSSWCIVFIIPLPHSGKKKHLKCHTDKLFISCPTLLRPQSSLFCFTLFC